MTRQVSEFSSRSGIAITRTVRTLEYHQGIDHLVEELNRKRGAFLSSGVEDPDRYSRYDFGFVDPPLEIVGRERRIDIRALNQRGQTLLAMLSDIVAVDDSVGLDNAAR